MTPEEAISVAGEQKQWWISQGVTSRRAWFRLTGKSCRDVEWSKVEAFMIRWLLNQDEPERLAA